MTEVTEGPVFDPEAEPVDMTDQARNEDEVALQEFLWSLQRIKGLRDQLDKDRAAAIERAVPLLKRLGHPAMVMNPLTGSVQVAMVREDETLEVDAGELLAALIEHFKADGMGPMVAEDMAETVWKDVLKPPTVDTKEGGAFQRAVDHGRIPGHVVAKVARFKRKAAWIDFVKPKRALQE